MFPYYAIIMVRVVHEQRDIKEIKRFSVGPLRPPPHPGIFVAEKCLEFSEISRFKKHMKKLRFFLICPLMSRDGGGIKALLSIDLSV